MREKGSDTWQSMAEGFGAHLRELNIAMEIKSTETIKQAVIAGMGIELPVGAHGQPRTSSRQPGRARRAGFSA